MPGMQRQHWQQKNTLLLLNNVKSIPAGWSQRDQLIAAQPIVRKGFIISKDENGWRKIAVDPTKEVQVGYYHIKANDIEEAIAIAKDNPEFAFVPSATTEIKPIKMKEEETNFVYPK